MNKKIQKTITVYCQKFNVTEDHFLEKAALHLIGLTVYIPEAMEIIRRVEKAVKDRNEET